MRMIRQKSSAGPVLNLSNGSRACPELVEGQSAVTANGKRKFSLRAGLTLTEALFAAGILTIGVLGIMSLVPAATHQIGSATGSTIGANIAREALLALQNGQLAMADYTGTGMLYATYYHNSTTALDLNADTGILNTYGNWPAAIAAIDDAWDNAPADTLFYGCGAPTATSPWLCYTDASFRIPGEHVLTAMAWADLLTGTPMAASDPSTQPSPEFVPAPWADDYGWTATFLPVWKDEKDNTLGTVGPDGIPDGEITPATSYRVQIAVWRWRKWSSAAQAERDGMYDIKGAVQATFTGGSNVVTFDTPIHNAHSHGYIRPDDYGVWLCVDRIGEEDGTNDKHSANPILYLVSPFTHPGMATGDTMQVYVSMANPLNLVGLYDGYITPPSTRATP